MIKPPKDYRETMAFKRFAEPRHEPIVNDKALPIHTYGIYHHFSRGSLFGYRVWLRVHLGRRTVHLYDKVYHSLGQAENAARTVKDRFMQDLPVEVNKVYLTANYQEA